MVIGRLSTAAIHLDDDRVSRQHAELRNTPQGWVIADLRSGNGTFVNHQKIAEHALQDGDRIVIGSSTLIFHDAASETSRLRTSIVRTVPEGAGPQILANLGVLYEAATVVSHVLDVDELLGKILELVLGATAADHAAALLIDEGTGEIMPRSVRSRGDRPFAFSRTIVEHVRQERQGVLVSDAAHDQRFQNGESIVRHSLREVIAVPMRGRHETVGVLVLDVVSSGNRFSGEHLNLAVALAHQAALAIEETKYHRALLDAERLAAVGQAMAGMSHHIKNIMQGVRFGGDMIRAGLSDDDKTLIIKGWSLVEKNQQRIDRLILDMLSYSKEREPHKEPVDVDRLIRDVAESLGARGVPITVQAMPTVIPCDADAIHAAILNVVSNALDALDGTENPQVMVTLEGLTIIVDDNGPGVPPQQRDAIFQPFVSSKGTRGTGLGLPVSRKILREHAGDLTVSDSPLGGARFILAFPPSSST